MIKLIDSLKCILCNSNTNLFYTNKNKKYYKCEYCSSINLDPHTLINMLNSKGSLFCMTSIYDESIDFDRWNYKNDQTHVFFYHRKALEWIKNEFNFSKLEIGHKLIKLIK